MDESRTKEPAIFTLKQVKMIIERLWKEREQHIREEYEKVLSEKLAGEKIRIGHTGNLIFSFRTIRIVCEVQSRSSSEKIFWR